MIDDLEFCSMCPTTAPIAGQREARDATMKAGMKMNRTACFTIGAFLAVLVDGSWVSSYARAKHASSTYDLAINPSDFVPSIEHKYFTLKPGTTFTYEKKTKKGWSE
jgi:hypothetical protein